VSYLTGIREDLESKGRGTNEKKRVSAIHEIYNIYRKQQKNYRLSWLSCSAFARGIHHAIINESDKLVTPELPEGRKRSKDNQIGAWKDKMMSRVTRVRPEFEVVPGEMSLEQLDTAQVGTAFLQHSMKINNWEKKRYSITSNCLDFGNCYAYLRDEEDKTRLVTSVQHDIGGEIELENGEPRLVKSPINEVKWEVLLPYNVFHDLAPGSLSSKYEAILAFGRDLTYFDLKYGKKVIPETTREGLSQFDLSIISRRNYLPESTEMATELVYLRPPNDRDEKGKVIICTATSGEILDEFDWPYQYLLQLPLVRFSWGEPPPGEFYARSPIEDQIPLNKDLNESLSIIQENIYNVGHVKWANPRSSGITTIDDLSGELITYTPGSEPHQMGVASLPNYEVMHPSRLRAELEDMQHFHSVSKGEAGGGPRSEVGLSKLEEEDSEHLNTIDDFFGDSYRELAEMSMKIAAEKNTIPQMIKYVGEGRRRAIQNFKGSMLDPNSSVTVRMVDGYLRNKGTVQRTVIELAHNGLITDKFGNPDPMRVQKMLQFAIPEVMYDKENAQREMAYEENEDILDGVSIEAKEWEYQAIHLEVIEELLNSREFKLRIKEDEGLLERAVNHRLEHQMLLAKAMGIKVPGEEEKEEEASP